VAGIEQHVASMLPSSFADFGLRPPVENIPFYIFRAGKRLSFLIVAVDLALHYGSLQLATLGSILLTSLIAIALSCFSVSATVNIVVIADCYSGSTMTT
jgi:hypothetical protein